uniref:Peptidase M12B domain-containing protein n=1 Tax=Parascaris equorum TaxID=6256 RepID=A0A914S2W8_PAREQ
MKLQNSHMSFNFQLPMRSASYVIYSVILSTPQDKTSFQLRFYDRDMKKLRRAVTSLLQALDLVRLTILLNDLQYLYQIDLRIIVVDIIELNVHNVTLEYMANYRSEKYAHLPEHDLAILISNAYEGGIAYVNGICSRSAVGIIGFFADAPMEYASIFFHELAHLLGLSHDALVSCACNSIDSDEGCLKIDGFDYDCSVQALVEKLPEHICIQLPPQNVPKTALAVCGNQIVEQHEECDCGPERFCKSMICDAATCTRTISDMQILTILTKQSLIRIGYHLLLLLSCISKKFISCICKKFNVFRDTPTFMPLVSSLSDSRAPIWNASMLSDDNSNFTTPYVSPVKLLASPTDSTSKRDSYLPPVPPRLVNYVNITHAKSTDNLPQVGVFSPSSTLLNKAQTLDRNTRRMTTPFHQQVTYFQCLSPSLSSFKSNLPTSKSLRPNCVHYSESNSRNVLHLSEVKSSSLNRSNSVQRRLVFSTDVSWTQRRTPTSGTD